jgi:hypothetical protein
MPNLGSKMQFITLHPISIKVGELIFSIKIFLLPNFIILHLAVILEWGANIKKFNFCHVTSTSNNFKHRTNLELLK